MNIWEDSNNEATNATPSATNSQTDPASLPLLPPSSLRKRKPNQLASDMWDHFTRIGNKDDPDSRCRCNYCGKDCAFGSKTCETSTLMNHLNNQCKKYLGRLSNKKQKILSFDNRDEGGESNLIAVDCSKEECRVACAKMVIMDELPFSFVESQGFRLFCNVACPQFDPPSSRILVKDIYQLYLDEKLKLRNIFSVYNQRVSLTTDTWTSIQNINYMSITAHYIDSDWTLHKRILSFCVVPNHKGETIGKAIESCLHEWGIEKVFTITVDNASANDIAISYLKRKMIGWGNDVCVLDGKYLHMRCIAHMINLIVCEGLKEVHDSIVSIRNAVKFVKSSTAMYEKLKECAKLEKIDCKSHVFLDVPTRWNSTYLMLEAALKFQKAFERLEEEDVHYLNYFREDDGGRRRCGPPSTFDWNNVSVFVKILKNFFNVTLTFSTSSHVTSCSYLHEVCTLVTELDEWSLSGDLLLSEMATTMKKKFDNYWGKMENVNQLLLVATVFDPRFKLDYVEYCFGDLYKDEVVASDMTKTVKANLISIYEWYVGREATSQSSQIPTETNLNSCPSGRESCISSVSSSRISRFLKKIAAKNCIQIKNDVERYLLEACEGTEDNDFDVLNWWRVNKSKYSTLSKLARDVLASQVSTVASESAFSIGGRILDPFHSSLSSKLLEVLVCTQSWFKSSPNLDGFYMEDVEHYNKLGEEICESIKPKSTEEVVKDK